MVLRAEHVYLGYGKKSVVEDFNLNVSKGEIVSIIGPNGSGKTTILKSLARYLKPQQGKVYLEDQDIFQLNTRYVARRIAVLPQVKSAAGDLKVEDLIEYGRYPHLKFGRRMNEEDHRIVDWALERTGLSELRHRPLATLSGGERQRAWIAMALAQKPEIMLLDEPTAFLDISYQLEVLELVKELNETLGLTIVMVLHDLNHAARYSHRIVAVKDGEVRSAGEPQKVLTGDLLKTIFRIEADMLEDKTNACPHIIPQRVVG